MNLREVILAEHSKAHTLELCTYVGDNKKRFKELMKLFLGPEYRITQRAAWIVSYCVENHPELIKPYISKMVDNLYHEGLHDAVKRNTLRIFQFIDIPEKEEGKLFDICMKFLLSSTEAIAIKAFGVTVLNNIAKKHPDLQLELKLVVEDLAQHAEEPALKVRYRRVLKDLNRVR